MYINTNSIEISNHGADPFFEIELRYSGHNGFLNTVKVFITTTLMVSFNLRGMKFLGELGILKDLRHWLKTCTCMLYSLIQLVGVVCPYFWEKGDTGKQCVCNIVPRYRFSSVIQIYEQKAELFLGTLIILSQDFKMEELYRLLSLIQQFSKRSLRALSFLQYFCGKMCFNK